MSAPFLVAVAGASGSGKTALARELARELGGTHLHIDHYYRDGAHLAPAERPRQNFDHPAQIEHELLLAHLRALLAGEAVNRPTYDFATHTRLPGQTRKIYEPHAIILDGIFALHWPKIRELAAVRVYVDTPDALCFERRLRRDVRERGRGPEEVHAHYAATVRPMAEQFVRPSAGWAHLTVDGASSLDWSVEQVLAALRARKLLHGSTERHF